MYFMFNRNGADFVYLPEKKLETQLSSGLSSASLAQTGHGAQLVSL